MTNEEMDEEDDDEKIDTVGWTYGLRLKRMNQRRLLLVHSRY
jgi:hypothetical protein